MNKYNENASSDSYETVISAETGLPINEIESSKARDSMKELVKWSIDRRGGPFASLPKQYKAMSLLKKMGILPEDVRNRWSEMEEDRFYKEKGFDFMDVVSSFNKKPLK